MTIFYESFSIWEKILFLLSITLIITVVFRPKMYIEGFKTEIKGFTEKSNDDLYDDFYSEIYDYLVFSDVRNEYEVGKIINATEPSLQSVILDIGCGTGNVVNLLNEKGLNIIGVDNSQAMINKTINKYPQLKMKLVKGNVLQTHLFPHYRFTHILCLYFTIYYLKNKSLFLENVYDWLKPGGFFVLHLVNRDKFSPILPMNTHKRYKNDKTYSKIQFTHFDYDSNFELYKDANTGIFRERFKNKQGETRKQQHTFYMENQKTIITIAQKIGFIIHSKISMEEVRYNDQYLYILKKPY
jgi:ubiquinone/menaquinone biosynthesis C-methylase UbiE